MSGCHIPNENNKIVDHSIPCPKCHGVGKLYSVVGISMPDDPGISVHEKCDLCKGTGLV
jgi:hypothetical protein